MKTIKLANGFSVLVDDEDYQTLVEHKWHVKKCPRVKYAITYMKTSNGKYTRVMMHRMILSAFNKIDHINGNGLDNRRSNLRECTQSQNLMNRARNRNNKVGFKGVNKTKSGKYSAIIGVNSKCIWLGTFKTKEEAAKSYDKAAMIYHGRFAHLNFKRRKK